MPNNRITPQIKAIADAHIKARIDNSFDDPKASTIEEIRSLLVDGKTLQGVLEEIEIRYCPITSIFIARQMKHSSKAYVSGVYKGFKILLGK